MSRIVYFSSTNEALMRFAEGLASGWEAELITDRRQLDERIPLTRNSRETQFDYVADTEHESDFINLRDWKIPSNHIHLAIGPNQRHQAIDLAEASSAGNFIFFSEPFLNPREHGMQYARMCKPLNFSGSPALSFHLEPNSEIRSHMILVSHQKQSIVSEVHSELLRHQWHPKKAASIANSIDELVMNAIFDSPVDSNGQQLHRFLPRSTRIDLDQESNVEFQYSIDDKSFVAWIKDQSGTLQKESVFQHLFKAFQVKTAITRPEDQQGSGLGLSLILRSGGSLCFRCVPGKRSEVIVYFEKKKPAHDMRTTFQFVSTCFDGQSI